MLIDHVLVRWRVLALVVASLAAGCTKPNPRSCLDGTCTDPAFPFCDVDGALEGQPNTCIAVECTPLEFAGCRGDLAITCNTAGTDFELVQCERGCEEGTGCRLCDPNETACTNGTVATCDAAGTVVSSQPCPLGCFEDEPRCRDIDPSNGLAQFLDLISENATLDLTGGGTIITDTGEIRDAQNNVITIPSTLVPAPPGGSPVRVFMAHRVLLGGVVRVEPADIQQGSGGAALAIVANEEIVIDGELTLFTTDDRVLGSAGGVSIIGCNGGNAFQKTEQQSILQFLYSGSGGGGHATAGGNGGAVTPLLDGGAGGAPTGNAMLVPLRGGCASGPSAAGGDSYGGGGAVQLVSRTAIQLRPNAIINVNGLGAVIEAQGPVPMTGGGAGGGILLEAPQVVVGSGARLLANGAGGVGGSFAFAQTSSTTAVSAGGQCTSSGMLRCTSGGNGAALDGPATSAADVTYTTSSTIRDFWAGGGGGGLGYIRINTAEGSHTLASDAIESGSISEGVVGTR